MSWRDRYRERIAAVIEANADQPLAAKRKALREAFPDGPRQYHPYKIWCDECRIQLKLKRSKVRVAGIPVRIEPAPGQRCLFE